MLDQLIEQLRSRRLTVLTFDPQRQSWQTDLPFCAGWSLSKSELRSRGLSCRFAPTFFWSLNEIVRQRSTDEVIVELACEVELPGARDTLLHRFPGGIYLGNIARLTRSIRVVHANGLMEELGASSGLRTRGGRCGLGKRSQSRARTGAVHRVRGRAGDDGPHGRRSDTFRRAVQLLRGQNPAASIVDAGLKNFETVPVATSLDETLWNDDADRAPHRLRSRWAVLDTNCARLIIRAAWPFHPQRFHEFVEGAWRGVLRGRGQVWPPSPGPATCGLRRDGLASRARK